MTDLSAFASIREADFADRMARVKADPTLTPVEIAEALGLPVAFVQTCIAVLEVLATGRQVTLGLEDVGGLQ